MLKYTKKIIAVLLILTVFCLCNVSAFAATTSEESVKNSVQELVDKNGIEATVERIAQNKYQELWNQKLMHNENVIDFLKSTKTDGYKEIDQNKDTALKITDDLNSSLFVYYFSKAYKNSSGDTIVALFVYYPQTNSIMRIYGEKIDKNNNSQFYYDSLKNESESSKVSAKLALKAIVILIQGRFYVD